MCAISYNDGADMLEDFFLTRGIKPFICVALKVPVRKIIHYQKIVEK